jgi:hypothetical protein
MRKSLGGRCLHYTRFVVFGLGALLAGCNSGPLEGWIKSANTNTGSLTDAITTGKDLKILSYQASDTRRFLTNISGYEPNERCVDKDHEKEYENELALFDSRREVVQKLADYSQNLADSLAPKPGAFDEALNTSLELLGAAESSGLAVPAAAGKAATALKKFYAMAKKYKATADTYELARKNNEMIGQLIESLSETLSTVSREAAAAQKTWENCEMDSLNFIRHTVPGESSKSLALMDLEARHKKFLLERQEIERKLFDLTKMAKKDENNLILPLGRLWKAHQELAKGPSLEITSATVTEFSGIAAAIRDLVKELQAS